MIQSKRYTVVQLRFDRESFDALKGLLREQTMVPDACVSAGCRLTREALKRVFDQMRNTEYKDE